MRIRNKLSRVALGWVAAGLLLSACSSTPESSAAQPSEEEMAKMMAEMQRLATPGPEHQALAKRVGTWKVTFKHRMSPDAPWEEHTGTTQSRMILDGRYLQEETAMHQTMMPGFPPMKGLHILGFDNLKGEYVATWMDSWSTWSIHSRGKADETGAIQLAGKMIDIMGERPFRMVLRENADGSSTMEYYDEIVGQGEVLVMEATQTRF